MPLYLVQHGLSLPKEQDPERGLSETGMSDTRRIADVAKGYKVKVSAIVHSGKKRAWQTAEIFAAALCPENGVKQQDGLAPTDDVTVLCKTTDSHRNVMYVGHLPFMERFVSHLVAGRMEPPVLKFQNSGIVCLDRDPDTGNWSIKWTLMPNIGN
jgi:phosphohistidine phosphatase